MLVLTAVPPGLRGHLTRWLLEIAPGIYVGFVTARVRELMWSRIEELMVEGRAFLVHSTAGEQRLAFRTLGHDWTPVDFDGVTLMRRREDAFERSRPPIRTFDSPSGDRRERSPSTAFSAAEIRRRRQSRRKFRRAD